MSTITTMTAVRIDKREARRRFTAGELIALSTTGDHATCGTWHKAGDWFATFADIERLNTASVGATARIYWYAPAPTVTPQGDQTDDDRLERDLADPLIMANVTGLRTYTAPCGDDFETADDASAHEAYCGACAGATEAHETEDEMTVYFDQLTANDDTDGLERLAAMKRHPSHASVSATFDRMHDANRVTIDNLTAMADRALDAGNLPAARDLLHRIKARQTANARIEACWTAKS